MDVNTYQEFCKSFSLWLDVEQLPPIHQKGNLLEVHALSQVMCLEKLPIYNKITPQFGSSTCFSITHKLRPFMIGVYARYFSLAFLSWKLSLWIFRRIEMWVSTISPLNLSLNSLSTTEIYYQKGIAGNIDSLILSPYRI